MSIYAQFESDGPSIQIASNPGWSDFGNWAETLEPGSISSLFEDGEAEDIPALREELESILKSAPPDDQDVADIAHSIIEAIDSAPDRTHLLVTNGTAPDDGTDEHDPTVVDE